MSHKSKFPVFKDNDVEMMGEPQKKNFPHFKYCDYDVEQNIENSDTSNMPEYKYPKQKSFKYTQKTDPRFGPITTDWIHNEQYDDEIDDVVKRKSKIVKKLMKIEFPAQKSEAWHALRFERVTASDGGCVVGVNKYEPPFKFLYKKVMSPPFQSNINCYHGNKFEKVATMIYEYRMNVQIVDFGLIKHPNCSFLAASPDGIIGMYKADGVSKTKHVGRMLEIKCPTTRQINTTGDVKGTICPIYYWVQVQLQLQCCNLDECDFWQCKLTEYDSREDFIKDTNPNEPFRSRSTGHEKGCLIQVLPKNRYEEVKNGKYDDVVYESSKHVYMPKINMSPYDCDIWLAESMAHFDELKLLDKELNISDYYFDKVVYWKLEKSHCVLIERDDEWYEKTLPTIAKMWSYVEYLRANKDKAELLFAYSASFARPDRRYPDREQKLDQETVDKIMDTVDFICNEPLDKKKAKTYAKRLLEIQEETKANQKC